MEENCASVTPMTPKRIRPVDASSQLDRKKGTMAKNSANSDSTVPPPPMVLLRNSPWNTAHTASHPWSNSCPRGDDEPVRRACFPSMASSVWYRNMNRAAVKKAQAGGSPRRPGV